MTFEEVLDQAIAMLQHRGRLTYRTLKRQFSLNDEALEDLKLELIEGQRLATDENGTVLVWTGETESPSALESPQSSGSAREQKASPISYTPQRPNISRKKSLPPAQLSKANGNKSPSCSLTSRTQPS